MLAWAGVPGGAAQSPPGITAYVHVTDGGNLNIYSGARLQVGGGSGAVSDAALSALLAKVGLSTRDELIASPALDFSNTGLDDADCAALATILTTGGSSVSATVLNLSDNPGLPTLPYMPL